MRKAKNINIMKACGQILVDSKNFGHKYILIGGSYNENGKKTRRGRTN